MDFIDFETYHENDLLPQPQPALSLPISSNIESLGKRFSSFNNLTRNLLKREEEGDQESNPNNQNSEESKLAQKYADLSLNLLKGSQGLVSDEKSDGDTLQELDISSTKTLSSRLSRVLNTPLSDSMIREIFTTLEPKINDIDNLVEPGVIGSVLRKQFRGSIESDLIKSQSLVLKEYQPVIKQLKVLEDRLNDLNSISTEATSRIESDFEATTGFNKEVKQLNKDKLVIDLKKNLLISFKNKFTLNEYEEYVLNDGEINEEFFVVLAKAESISDKCSILLSIDNSQLGLKIMNKINQLVNKSINRIINITNKTLSNLYSLNTKSKLETLQKCLRYLKNKLNYFNSIINTFTESRSKVIVDEFFSQVNGNLDKINSYDRRDSSSRASISSDSSGRPIYLSAHDPIRFIGDLLAYVHSVIVNERELISNIFILEYSDESEREEFQKVSNDVASKTLKALSRPLKSRIDQIISSETKLATLFQIFNLLDLYQLMFTKQLKDSDSNLVRTISDLIKLSQEKIMNILKNRLATIRSSNLAQLDLNIDLQPPEWIIEFYFDLLPVIDQITTPTILNLSKEDNDKFLKLIVDEPISIFNEHVQNNVAKSFNKRDQLILKQNFLDVVLFKIMPLSLLSDKTLEINDAISSLTQELTNYQLITLLDEAKLTDYYNVINMICPFEDEFFDLAIYEPITENKLFNKEYLREVNITIQEFLPTALLDIQKSLLKVNSPLTVNDITTNSSIEFTKFYLKFDLICKEYLKEQLFTWSDIEVATLLGVENTYLDLKKLILLE
ncbi:oligomeric complex COG6 [Hyphopichia burtonii NRRL Y-1933]|uniref:Conserved oligomeric Golgi complex subunit 6 n=1 Tax=Hyphopichia burtonii NRRL Y-1933 TaxID=984485 RepID=A0A1E4RCU1_9ASCO|nr:oligomeric complex COG6 [Hyphopichia burtonii NRRL Y-1933]ODV65084.1 oligomeric complex COG6 [Hyphopichia burtonii NRRL Y-1933]